MNPKMKITMIHRNKKGFISHSYHRKMAFQIFKIILLQQIILMEVFVIPQFTIKKEKITKKLPQLLV